MKNVIRLRETELVEIVKMVINENKKKQCINISNSVGEIQSEITNIIIEKLKKNLFLVNDFLSYFNTDEIENKLKFYINEVIKIKISGGKPIDFNSALYTILNLIIKELNDTYQNSYIFKSYLSFKIDENNVKKIINDVNGMKIFNKFYLEFESCLNSYINMELRNWFNKKYADYDFYYFFDNCIHESLTNIPPVSQFISNLNWLKNKIIDIVKYHA